MIEVRADRGKTSTQSGQRFDGSRQQGFWQAFKRLLKPCWIETNVLCGGRLSGEQLVSEQYLLDLEREAFLSLCGDPRTQARMAHMLKTGKPLRN